MLRLGLTNASRAAFVAPRTARPLFTGTGIKSWIDDLTSQPAEESTDTIDNLRATRLVQTLPTRENLIGGTDVEEGGPLPKAHHLVYFNPDAWLGQLGADGTNTASTQPPSLGECKLTLARRSTTRRTPTRAACGPAAASSGTRRSTSVSARP